MLAILLLVALDQGIKLLIARFMMDAQFIIIPHVFRFKVAQNIHLGWVWNMIDFMMPLVFAVALSVLVIIIIIIYSRYMAFNAARRGKHEGLPPIILTFVLAAAFCKLIDDIFWGGSLDYIGLFNWFIFDLKDVYITFALGCLVFFEIVSGVYLSKLPKEKRKELGFLYWARLGFPNK